MLFAFSATKIFLCNHFMAQFTRRRHINVFIRPSPLQNATSPAKTAIRAFDALLREKRQSVEVAAWQHNASCDLHALAPLPHTQPKKRRVGRSRTGRFCGRGIGGSKSCAGKLFSRLFAGGNVPFHLRVPKSGAVAAERRMRKNAPVNVALADVQLWIDAGRIDATRPITVQAFDRVGIDVSRGVRIVGCGADAFNESRCKFVASSFDQEAIGRIEELGGLAVAAHLSSLAIRTICAPESFLKWRKAGNAAALPRISAPVAERKKVFYFSWRERGYLHPDMQARIKAHPDVWDAVFHRAVVIAPRPDMPQRVAAYEAKQQAAERQPLPALNLQRFTRLPPGFHICSSTKYY